MQIEMLGTANHALNYMGTERGRANGRHMLADHIESECLKGRSRTKSHLSHSPGHGTLHSELCQWRSPGSSRCNHCWWERAKKKKKKKKNKKQKWRKNRKWSLKAKRSAEWRIFFRTSSNWTEAPSKCKEAMQGSDGHLTRNYCNMLKLQKYQGFHNTIGTTDFIHSLYSGTAIPRWFNNTSYTPHTKWKNEQCR